MKWLGIAILFSCMSVVVLAQPISTDSVGVLEKELSTSPYDTNRVNLLRQLGAVHVLSNPSVAQRYLKEGLALARKLNYRKGEADCIRWSGNILKRQGQYPEALDNLLNALKISEEIGDSKGISASLGHIGNVYDEQGEYAKARMYYNKAKKIDETNGYNFELALMLSNLGKSYQEQNKLDSALLYYDEAYAVMTRSNNNFLMGALFTNLGDVQAKLGHDAQAMTYFRNSIPFALSNKAPSHLSEIYQGIANLFKKREQLDSCIFYAKRALASAQEVNYGKGILGSSKILTEAYERIDKNEAFRYYKIAMAAKDSLFNAEKVKQVQNLGFMEQQRLQAIDNAKVDYQNRIRLYTLLFSTGAFLLLAIVLYRNNRNKQMANTLLEQQKVEIQRTLHDLKTTQTQLIQSEKMASLGELTAGIAHEIQNPLNFVNNFSEINKELIDELEQEIDSGNSGEAKAVAKSIRENEEKINHHGKRADAIVKGMLQHSRSSSSVKEPTDINALADEYLRLAYHGLRAKDKSFNAQLNTEFDKSLGALNVVPQDIGRAILNLITNAFYAVAEKKKTSDASYEPTVLVRTKKMNGFVTITVKDNGNGIPQKVVDKIFQPFFTTKPTGQGTGLGLSLSYDIVKAHGGELKVETEENVFSEFSIQLPII